MSLNHELADIFARMAAVLDIKGENTFKAIAFSKVSRLLKDSPLDLRQAAAQGTLEQIEGIGASSHRVIVQYLKDGHSSDHDELVASVPAGLLPMMEIPGLGPKTIALLWKQRGITSVEELVAAMDGGELAGLKGIGEKKIESIRQGIELLAQSAGRMGIVEAWPIAQALLQRLREMAAVKQAEIAGSLRRGRETIGDVDLVCSLEDATAGEAIAEAFVKFPEVQRILGQGVTKASVITAGGLQVDLRIVPIECFGAAWLYFTGSKDHNVKLRSRAQDNDLTLNEWGLYSLDEFEKAPKKSGHAPELQSLAGKTEQSIYRKLKLQWIPPELREDRGELQAAETDHLPKLIELADIHADLHTHTTASDGRNSIDEMAEAAIARGYKMLAITDHSKSQTIANGLSAERLLKHVKEIHKAAERYKKQIVLLAGCEVDILPDGRMDFEDAVLAELDWVVGSPHISLKQDEQKATDRLKRAIENRYVNVIGHPTGRLINSRAGLPIDFAKIFPLAASTGTALEINAGYPRLDLNDVNARAAIAAGVTLSINTDAHSIEGLDEMKWGVVVARRAWAEAKNVLNCWDADAVIAFVAKKRKG